MNNDTQLIAATLAGDSSAFGDLVVRYQDRLFNMLVRLVGCEQEARDVAQEAFLQAWQKLSSFRGNAKFTTWLYRVAFNIAISRRRKAKPALSVERLREEAGEEPADHTLQPDEPLMTQERIAMVERALSELKEEQRFIVTLREMDELSYEEIAEILDVPVGTVRSRLFRARDELRKVLSRRMADHTSD